MYTLWWFRRDLRLEDNAGLYHALKSGDAVLPVFIFDTDILDRLEERKDRRVEFIHRQVSRLKKELRAMGSDLWVLKGKPLEVYKEIISKIPVSGVYTNHDYEPYARKRDAEIAGLLRQNDISFHSFKDQVIFEKQEILSQTNSVYTVFTPYSRRWKEKLNNFYLRAYPTLKYKSSFVRSTDIKALQPELPALNELGFDVSGLAFPPDHIDEELIRHYAEQRDYPSIQGTSRLSVHLRFGTVSIRELASRAKVWGETFLNELIWRDFYMQILWNFPHVEKQSFKKEYDHIPWRNNEKEFQLWCEGNTGYPIVDAGMRELNATGFMHNRVRMIVASFLTKHLLVDWRWGEAYFAQKLLDFDLAANNGGWQWAAGSGCDAAPYFRIFNPAEQTRKFDPGLKYIRRWVPELDSLEYPLPVVDHKFARERALETYKKALASKTLYS